MRRASWLAAGLLAGFAVTPALADPPGPIVIRPRAPGSTPATTPGPADPTPSHASPPLVPDKPGFVVIRPRGWPVPATGTVPGTTLVGDPRTPPGSPAPATPAAPVAPAAADPKLEDGQVRLETWDVLFVRGVKAGHFHTVVREFQRDNKPFLYGVKRANLTVARFGQRSEQWTEEANLETPAGEVLTTRVTQGIGKDQQLSLEGVVEGRTLRVKISGQINEDDVVPFPEGVVGVAGESRLFKDRKPKPGDTFQYSGYLGGINRTVVYTVAVRAVDQLSVYEGQKPRAALRVDVTAAKVGPYQHPPATVWVDAATFDTVRLDTVVPMLGGKVTVLRTTKDYATRRAEQVPELNEFQSIVLDKPVPDVHARTEVLYRVKLDGGLSAAEAFTQDSRQKATPVPGETGTFDLAVTARRVPGPAPAGAPADPGTEFRDPSFFIDWQSDAVRQNTAAALAGLPADATAWSKAQAVERWVHANMKPAEFSQAMATCGNTAKTLSGDCTEYAMLGAGMCRAAGVPARTALGLVYAPARDGRGTLAYHMWFEAYADGQWLPLDGTLGRGSVGPGHLKITDASWHKEKGFAPLLPVLAVTGSEPKVGVREVR